MAQFTDSPYEYMMAGKPSARSIRKCQDGILMESTLVRLWTLMPFSRISCARVQ